MSRMLPIQSLRRSYILLLGLLLSWSMASPAQAGDCGSRTRPSASASCSCSPSIQKGKLQHPRRRSARLCWQQAAEKAKRNCTRSSSANLFAWKKGRLARRTCEISFQCTQQRAKQKGTKLSTKTSRKQGAKLVQFKHRISQNRRPCVQAAKQIQRKVCGPSAQSSPVRFAWRKASHRVKLMMGFKKGHCRIAWTCWFKKKTPVYWCR